MDRTRVILHSDLNAFYASVETMLNPSLQGKAVAVCGSTEDRHGIVLAKSELAKKSGIKTGMANWEARQLCPGLITLPPQFDQYVKYSRMVREIYLRYTDQVEPYGLDECWLDLTANEGLNGDGITVAEAIRKTVSSELGLTVSIGVSFNKIFAKLGSDLKKPDAVSVIDRENFRDKIWGLPAGELLFVGRSTEKKLAVCGIRTIGDIAKVNPEFLERRLGKNGRQLWGFASGNDNSRVMTEHYEAPIKSIGHGITCTADLLTEEEVWRVILELSQDVGHRLRLHGLCARGVQITVKDNGLSFRQYQAQLHAVTQSPTEIALLARSLFSSNYRWHANVRAVTVRAINLVPECQPDQLTIYADHVKRARKERMEDAVEQIRSRFGSRSIVQATLMGDLKIPNSGIHEVTLPGLFYM